MENDWDQKLLRQILSENRPNQRKDFESDLMLQPITTQQKFNAKNKSNNETTNQKTPSDPKYKPTSSLDQPNKNIKNSHDKNQSNRQKKNFLDYLSAKVNQIKKPQQENKTAHNQGDKKEQHKKQSSNVRKIVNQQESKQLEPKKQKAKSSLGKPNTQHHINKQSNNKRYTNSHSSLTKSTNQKNITQNNLPEIKKSFNFQENPKATKYSNVSSNTKIALSSKNQPAGLNQQAKRKTIDTLNSKSPQRVETDIKNTPSSKNSFRIKRNSNAPQITQTSIQIKKNDQIQNQSFLKDLSIMNQGRNKRMREQFIKLNQKEKILQEEILKNLEDNKMKLEPLLKKFKISGDKFQKYGIKKDIQQLISGIQQKKSPQKKQFKQSRMQKLSQKQITDQSNKIDNKKFQSPFQKQKYISKLLKLQLQKINNLMGQKDKQIKKGWSRLQKMALMRFIKQNKDDILEEPEEDQADAVEELPKINPIKFDQKYQQKDFSSTYSTVMNQMKNKKWGLKQRITFQIHRQNQENKLDLKNIKEHDKIAFKNQKISVKDQDLILNNSNNINTDQTDRLNNKIQVNSRLKSLLFE